MSLEIGSMWFVVEDTNLEGAPLHFGVGYTVDSQPDSAYKITFTNRNGEDDYWFLSEESILNNFIRVGEQVTLTEGAHGSESSYSAGDASAFEKSLASNGLSYDTVCTVMRAPDEDGDVFVVCGDIGTYVLPKFLKPLRWTETETESETEQGVSIVNLFKANEYIGIPTEKLVKVIELAQLLK